MNSLFCTNSTIGYGSGGGIVTYHIRLALQQMPSEVKFYDNYKLPLPELLHRLHDPFQIDRFIAEKEVDTYDLLMFYGSPFGLVAKKMKKAKQISDVAPHNIELSREEHQRLGLSFSYPHLNDPTIWRKYMKQVILADLVIVHSRFSGEYLKKQLKLTNRIEVLAHGCDPPNTVPPYPDTFTVGHLSVNGPDKGQIYLIRAWHNLGLDNAKLLIAGYRTERWGGLGYITDPSSFYPKITVYVQPTVTEGFGITVLEAMSYGRPIIVTEGAGVMELIEDGKDGFVVPIRDPDAISEKIKYFYNNPSEVERMGRNAREKAEKFTWNKIRSEYIKLFKEVVEDGKA